MKRTGCMLFIFGFTYGFLSTLFMPSDNVMFGSAAWAAAKEIQEQEFLRIVSK